MDTAQKIRYDFSKGAASSATGGRKAVLPEGTWDCLVHTLTPAISKANNAYTVLEFRVMHGAYTDAHADGGAYCGTPEAEDITAYRFKCFKPWAMGWLLVATGYAEPESEATVEVDLANLLDFPVVVEVRPELYQGKEQNNVVHIYASDAVPPPKGSVAALDAAIAAQPESKELEF